ncbi:hypothetical protein [Nonomuraea wenchangensis]|uniref:hypothetical protein n=1 Tax=Nonomuraea wenchangensis TaxID=568860 RepID=UPI003323CDC2
MVTVSQAVVAAYVVGLVGMLIGAAVVATMRSDRRHARDRHGGDIHPPTRLEQLLWEDSARYNDADALAEEWKRINEERDW